MHVILMALMMAGGHGLVQTNLGRTPRIPTNLYDQRYAHCPVAGGVPRPEIAVIRGNRVYHFCRQECAQQFSRRPRNFLGNLGVVQQIPLRTTNQGAKDPVTGHDIRKGKRIFRVRGDSVTFYASEISLGKDQADPEAGVSKDAARSETRHPGHEPLSGSAGGCH